MIWAVKEWIVKHKEEEVYVGLGDHFSGYRDYRWRAWLWRDSRYSGRYRENSICDISHFISGQPRDSFVPSLINLLIKNFMNKAIGLALLAVGIALIVYGINASDSASSHLSKAFTGSPTNKALWLLIGGIASAVCGAVLTLVPSHKS